VLPSLLLCDSQSLLVGYGLQIEIVQSWGVMPDANIYNDAEANELIVVLYPFQFIRYNAQIEPRPYLPVYSHEAKVDSMTTWDKVKGIYDLASKDENVIIEFIGINNFAQ